MSTVTSKYQTPFQKIQQGPRGFPGSTGQGGFITGAQVLAALLAVDGSGSGLDADLLDGEHGSHYAPLASPAFTDNVSLTTIATNAGSYLNNNSGATVGRFITYGEAHTSRANQVWLDANAASNVLILATQNIAALTVDASQKVGIGTAAPSQLLTVVYPFPKTDGTQRYISDFHSNDVTYPFALTIGAIGAAALANRVITLQTEDINSANGGNLALQAGGGNVGIGFISPLAKVAINGGLHVGGESDPGDNNILIDGYAQTEQVKSTTAFVSGFTGAGYKLIHEGGESSLTLDNLIVRRALTAYEMIINKISSINGSQIISAANGKVYSTSSTPAELSGWTNDTFDTFVSSGLNVTSGIDSGIAAAHLPNYNTEDGEVLSFSINLTLNSGTAPVIVVITDSTPDAPIALSAGVNTFNVTIVSGGVTVITIQTGGSATDFSAVIGIISNVQKIYFDEDGTHNQINFVADDFIRSQEFTGRGIASYKGKVLSVTHSATLGSAYIVAMASSGSCWTNADLVQSGNETDIDRQSIIYLTASDTNNPFIEILTGVDDGNFSGKQVARFGKLDGITSAYFGALSGIGIWTNNGYFEGSINSASGQIGGWTIESDKLSSTTTAIPGTVGIELNSDGNAILGGLHIHRSLGFYNYSQQSTPVTLTAMDRMYVCLDHNAESTLNLPSSGLPGSGSTTMLFITHKYGTGLGAAKYHIQGNGYKIIDAGAEVTSIDIDEGHGVILAWEPRGTSWYVMSKN